MRFDRRQWLALTSAGAVQLFGPAVTVLPVDEEDSSTSVSSAGRCQMHSQPQRICGATMLDDCMPLGIAQAMGEEGVVEVSWRCKESIISKGAEVIYLRRKKDRLIIAADISKTV